MEKLKYTNTKCLKDPTCAIFLKSRGFKDIKYDNRSGSDDNRTNDNRSNNNESKHKGSNDNGSNKSGSNNRSSRGSRTFGLVISILDPYFLESGGDGRC